MANLTIGSTTSLFSAGNTSGTTESSDSKGDSQKEKLEARREKLNDFLVASGKSPIGSTKKGWAQLSTRTKNVHLHKGKDAVMAVLDVIAPGHASALWKDLKISLEKDLSGTEANESPLYLQAIAEAYENMESWDTQRPILSIMADLFHMRSFRNTSL